MSDTGSGEFSEIFTLTMTSFTLDFTLYIPYKTTIFQQNYSGVYSKPILIIFAPEEAEIFKDYLFILA
jgi:hypothetical protein